ncbi:MAG: hypothetical protein U9O59_06905 [Actinomycetota bacterium]|nr:hypothetical protein [Actinomycetota bacterium]
MRVIIIILLIFFLSITSLLGVSIINISKDDGAAEASGNGDAVSGYDNGLEKSGLTIKIPEDIQRFFVINLAHVFPESFETITEETGRPLQSVENNDREDSPITVSRDEDEETGAAQTSDIKDTPEEEPEEEYIEDINGSEEDEESKEIDEEVKNNTVRFFLDGDMENGIYLGETISNRESAEVSEKYGEDFLNTGFKFTIKNSDNLNLLPGSTHYIYIYFYSEKSGWDYVRKEINFPGEEAVEKKITIAIDKPEEKSITDSLQLINGWAVDLRNKDNPGIKNIEIYLDGPKGYGKSIGDINYGIQRSDVANFLEDQDYLNSGYIFSKKIELETGSTHTLFTYAFSSTDDSYNYKKIEIYLSGTKEEKAIINARIYTQNLSSNDVIEITGWAIDKSILKEYQEEEEEEEEQATIRRLIFISNRDGNDNIYSINIDGTGLTRLTDSHRNDLYPEVSPDGEKIAYTSDIGGVWQIMVMDWNGGNKKQITNNNFKSAYPSWSYDGKYIYFEAYIEGDWELYRIGSNGTGQRRLTFNHNSHDWHPSGHPQGYDIVYESGVTGHENIYAMNHDGSGIIKICGDGPRRRVPDVSPDGKKITYMRYPGRYADIWIMDYNGQNETRLTDNSDEDGHSSFSPDNKYIVYEERKGSKEDLILINLATGEKTNITNSPYSDKDGSFLYHD